MVERLLSAGLGTWAWAVWLGRVPIGATPEPIGAVDDFVVWRGGDPPGDDVDVRLDC